MPQWIIAPEGLVEPVPAPEFFIDEIGAIQVQGPTVRIFYCALECDLYGGLPQRIVKLILRRPLVGSDVAMRRFSRIMNHMPHGPLMLPSHRLQLVR